MSRYLHFACLFCVVLGCNNDGTFEAPEAPENSIPRDSFVQIMTEVHLIEGALKQRLFRTDDPRSLAEGYYTELFDRWGIDKERFTTTYEWWYQQPEELDALLQEVTESLTEWERQLVIKEKEEPSDISASQDPIPEGRKAP